jgi:hypothetical protein
VALEDVRPIAARDDRLARNVVAAVRLAATVSHRIAVLTTGSAWLRVRRDGSVDPVRTPGAVVVVTSPIERRARKAFATSGR